MKRSVPNAKKLDQSGSSSAAEESDESAASADSELDDSELDDSELNAVSGGTFRPEIGDEVVVGFQGSSAPQPGHPDFAWVPTSNLQRADKKR